MYAAARVVGDTVRRVSDLDRAALEKDDFKFNIHLLLGGQVKGEKPNLFLIYPQGNPLSATEDSPYLQIGEVKYGRPILDRGIEFDSTSLDVAGTYALFSLDAAMRSNVTVGPPWKSCFTRTISWSSTAIGALRTTTPSIAQCMRAGNKPCAAR